MSSKPLIVQTIADSDRKSLERVFKDTVGHAPPIEHQGCNQLLATMNKPISEGRLEVHSNKQIIPFIPSPTVQTKTRGHDNTEYEELTHEPPAHEEDWMQQMRVFYTSLFMVLTAHKEMENLQVPWEVLRDFYEKFLFGPLVLKRKKPPSLRVIMLAERRCWREIAMRIYNGTDLSTALQDMRSDSLWWTNELESHKQNQTMPRQPGHSKGKGKAAPPQKGKPKENAKASSTATHIGPAAHSMPSQQPTVPSRKAKAKTKAKARKEKANSTDVD